LADALDAMAQIDDEHVSYFIDFVRASKRGFPRARRLTVDPESS